MDDDRRGKIAQQERKDDRTEDRGGVLSKVNVDQVLRSEARWALIGGSLAGSISLIGALGVGQLSGAEAFRLVEGLLPTTRFMSSGVMAAAATILALMLTLLSISHSTESELKMIHYRRIRHVSLLTVISLIASVVLLSFLIIPIQQSEAVPTRWYTALYYTLVVSSALLGGLFSTLVLMLYRTISELIKVIEPTQESSLIASDSDR